MDLPPILQSLFHLPDMTHPQSLTADIFWERVFDLPGNIKDIPEVVSLAGLGD